MSSPREGIALKRYLERYMETGLPDPLQPEYPWQQVAVLPAYREAPQLLENLQRFPRGRGRSLIVLVLNRPARDEDPQVNKPLRGAINQFPAQTGTPLSGLLELNGDTDLYLLDLESLRGPSPDNQGVGLARKAGFDLALKWMHAGVICSEWLYSIDADARLPSDFFAKSLAPDARAAVFPFQHVPGGDPASDAATALYELRLHHHVLGLQFAGSPYAFHTLGSCLAVRAEAYAQVRGFPRRAGAEDFYLLNKIAKLGPVTRLSGSSIQLQSRQSSRVPFGTGPAVQSIMATEIPNSHPLFYHPFCYRALRALLATLPEIASNPRYDLFRLLRSHSLSEAEARTVKKSLLELGIEDALEHCYRQSTGPAQFQRHFHQWFDAFLTLKFIHKIRDDGWPLQSLSQLQHHQPHLWPGVSATEQDVAGLRAACARHWDWE